MYSACGKLVSSLLAADTQRYHRMLVTALIDEAHAGAADPGHQRVAIAMTRFFSAPMTNAIARATSDATVLLPETELTREPLQLQGSPCLSNEARARQGSHAYPAE